jgi:hypothetical protein
MPPSAVSRGRRAAETHEEEESEDDVQIDEVDDNDVEGDEGDEDDEDDWESEEEEIAPRVLPQRSNRGNRLAKLIQEGEEEDEFWDVMKEVFVEDANDSDFEAEGPSLTVLASPHNPCPHDGCPCTCLRVETATWTIPFG